MVNLKHFILESEASSVKDEEQRMNNGAPLRQPANVQHLQKTFMGEATPTAARPMPPQEWVNQRTLQRQCPPHSECNHPEAELIVVFMPSDTSAVSSPPARPSSLQNGPGRGPQPPHVHVMVLCRPGLSANRSTVRRIAWRSPLGSGLDPLGTLRTNHSAAFASQIPQLFLCFKAFVLEYVDVCQPASPGDQTLEYLLPVPSPSSAAARNLIPAACQQNQEW
eukprot:CAMPEP_0174297630 /NCGR_PEP_ID=MMETSP0809-20121228/51581_1 /TAXON_ID=73025 ORGANISM="Eutreptiella gymnastica-like, Strain CCMP1594" /NCGR_SAMPLE_ID=MMETSP0809 /ASSEMBLY_ACC=CAM_ASM_000658 /LENGTH=221 /DNA_ID=CAMNT_0015401559 /DNA_START=603 /DNA_END=1266 /DNA_ORIENTATION=-